MFKEYGIITQFNTSLFQKKKLLSCCFAAEEESVAPQLFSCACVRALKPLNKDYLSKIFYYCSYIYIGKSSKLNCVTLFTSSLLLKKLYGTDAPLPPHHYYQYYIIIYILPIPK